MMYCCGVCAHHGSFKATYAMKEKPDDKWQRQHFYSPDRDECVAWIAIQREMNEELGDRK